jgi:hypothetical protein
MFLLISCWWTSGMPAWRWVGRFVLAAARFVTCAAGSYVATVAEDDMRYWKGSIALSPTQDYPLLRQVLRSTFVTHRQLYDFMRLAYCTSSRHSFNNRVRRLVKHNYLIRDKVPFQTDGYAA